MSQPMTREAMRGTASGVLFMAIFGITWTSFGMVGLQGWGFPWVLILSVLIGVGLMWCGFTLNKKSNQLPKMMNEKDVLHWNRVGFWFGINFAIEIVLIVIACVICITTKHFELFAPSMAIIVGAHFFPLARLFRVRAYYVTGVLLCLLSAVTMLFLPFRIDIGDRQLIVWWLCIGFGASLILWGTGVVVWLKGRNGIVK